MDQCIPFFKNDISWFEIIYTTLLPALIFFLGVWFSKIIENQKDKIKYRKLEKYFLGLLNQLVQKNINQINLLKQAAGSKDNLSSKVYMAKMESGESHQLLKEIDRSELYNGFVLAKENRIIEKTKIFEELISTIDFLYKFYVNFEETNKGIPVSLEKFYQIWDNAMLELINIINTFRLDANKKGIANDQLLDQIEVLSKEVEVAKKDKPFLDNIELGYQIYIDPLRLLLYKFPKDSRASTLMDIVQKLKYAYLMSFNEIEKSKKYFQDLSDVLSKENDDLKSLIANFKKN